MQGGSMTPPILKSIVAAMLAAALSLFSALGLLCGMPGGLLEPSSLPASNLPVSDNLFSQAVCSCLIRDKKFPRSACDQSVLRYFYDKRPTACGYCRGRHDK